MIQINIASHKQAGVSVFPISADKLLTRSGETAQNNASISNFFSSNEHQGEFGFIRTVYDNPDRSVFVGTGEIAKLSLQKLRALSSKTAQELNKSSMPTVDIYFTEIDIPET